MLLYIAKEFFIKSIELMYGTANPYAMYELTHLKKTQGIMLLCSVCGELAIVSQNDIAVSALPYMPLSAGFLFREKFGSPAT